MINVASVARESNNIVNEMSGEIKSARKKASRTDTIDGGPSLEK